MKIAISAETTIDMPKELLKQYEIEVVPFTVIMGSEEYLDGEIENNQIFEFVDKTRKLPKTSAVNKFQYEIHFKKLLKSYDAIIHISLSSEISCAYNNAVEVAKTMKNVYVLDSCSLSTGIALLAIKASEMITQNESVENIYNTLEKARTKVQASFVLNKLQYLSKGGRCSSLTSFGANLLRIKPQILVKDGKMQVGKKYVGKFDSCVEKYCEDTLNSFDNLDLNHAFVTYTTAYSQVIDFAKNALIKKGFKNVHITKAGATISSHCGPNTLGILFMEKND